MYVYMYILSAGFSLGSYKGACWPPITPEYPLIYHFLHCFVPYWKIFLIKNSNYYTGSSIRMIHYCSYGLYMDLLIILRQELYDD